MQRVSSIAALAAFLVGFVTPASAQDAPTVLAPSSNWHLDMAEHKCRLLRMFGPEDARTAFYLEQWEPSRAATWAVAGPVVDTYRIGEKANYAFGPGGDEGEIEVRDIELGDFGRLVSDSSPIVAVSEKISDENDDERDWSSDPLGLATLDAAPAKPIERFTLSQKGRAEVRLDLGPMDKALAALNMCTEDLVKHWGFDPGQQRNVVSPPRVTNMQKVVETIQREYPFRALRTGAQAYFMLRMTVAADGTIEDCVMVNQTVADRFGEYDSPCGVMRKKAVFEPAKDANGNGVRSYYLNRIFYRIG